MGSYILPTGSNTEQVLVQQCVETKKYLKGSLEAPGPPASWRPSDTSPRPWWPCPPAKTDTFEHSGDEENGENLYWSWSSDPRWVVEGDEPVRSWYDECRGYNYSREPRDTESGHFTQL